MPDFFRGAWFDPYDESKSQQDLGNFIDKYDISSLRSDIYDLLLPKIKEENELKSFGVMGFCWGAIPVFLCSADKQFQYGISFHPSIRLLKFMNEDPMAMAKKVQCPQQYFLTKQEHDYYRKGGEVYETFQKKF